jgi:hypothetical protein
VLFSVSVFVIQPSSLEAICVYCSAFVYCTPDMIIA